MKPDRPVLWIVCEVYYPELTSTGYYLTAIAEDLGKHRTVKVICGQPNYASRGTVAPKYEVRNGVEIFRAAGTLFDKNRIFKRVINMATLGTSTFVTALRRFRRGDQVVVATNPPGLPFVIATAALARGCSYTPLVHDVYPEQLVAMGMLRPNSFPVRVLNALNRRLFKHASKIIVVGRDMKELIARKAAGLDVRVLDLPNWAETDVVTPSPKPRNGLLSKLGIEDKFIFLFAGNFGRPTDVETLIAAADLIRGNTDVHFLMVGTGAKLPWVQQEVARRRLSNITLTGPMSREEQSVFLNAGDVGLVTLIPGMRGAAVPSRIYNLLAAGKPILALTDEGSEIEHIINEDRIGWAVHSRDPHVLKHQIERIYSERDKLPEIGERARKAAMAKYSPELALEKYRAVLA